MSIHSQVLGKDGFFPLCPQKNRLILTSRRLNECPVLDYITMSKKLQNFASKRFLRTTNGSFVRHLGNWLIVLVAHVPALRSPCHKTYNTCSVALYAPSMCAIAIWWGKLCSVWLFQGTALPLCLI